MWTIRLTPYSHKLTYLDIATVGDGFHMIRSTLDWDDQEIHILAHRLAHQLEIDLKEHEARGGRLHM